MTKLEIANKIAQDHKDVTKKNVEAIVTEVFDALSEALTAGDKVSIAGFGVFDIKERAARKGRNPQTGAEIEIAASKNVHFKAGKALKDALNA